MTLDISPRTTDWVGFLDFPVFSHQTHVLAQNSAEYEAESDVAKVMMSSGDPEAELAEVCVTCYSEID